MPRGRPIDAAERDEVLAFRLQGLTQEAIAQRLGITRQAVQGMLKHMTEKVPLCLPVHCSQCSAGASRQAHLPLGNPQGHCITLAKKKVRRPRCPQ